MRPASTPPTRSTTRPTAGSSTAAGLKYVVVEAHSGAMGGSQSHEFMVASDAGEDFVVVCDGCGYAANLEKAVSRRRPRPAVADPEGDLAPEEFHTPGRKTIAEVAEFTGLPETSQMKSLVMVADGKPVLALLRGDHQLSETKFGAPCGAIRSPAGASRGDPGVVRRRRGLARAGRREEHARDRGFAPRSPPRSSLRSRAMPPARGSRSCSAASSRSAARWCRAARRRLHHATARPSPSPRPPHGGGCACRSRGYWTDQGARVVLLRELGRWQLTGVRTTPTEPAIGRTADRVWPPCSGCRGIAVTGF